MWKKSNDFYNRGHKKIAKAIYIFMRVVFSCDIPYSTNIGDGTVFKHEGLGVVINSNAIIGKRCTICQQVQIGGRSGQTPPRIGDDVLLGASSLILGDIYIGNGAQIGAGAVVVTDIPDYSVAVGNPAKVIKRIN